jgi:hypothetical protein
VPARKIVDRRADRTSPGAFAFDICPQAVEIGRQSLAAPNHRAGFIEVSDRQSEGYPLYMIQLMIVALKLAAQRLGEALSWRAG